jgi:hypothetical protein
MITKDQLRRLSEFSCRTGHKVNLTFDAGKKIVIDVCSRDAYFSTEPRTYTDIGDLLNDMDRIETTNDFVDITDGTIKTMFSLAKKLNAIPREKTAVGMDIDGKKIDFVIRAYVFEDKEYRSYVYASHREPKKFKENVNSFYASAMRLKEKKCPQ